MSKVSHAFSLSQFESYRQKKEQELCELDEESFCAFLIFPFNSCVVKLSPGHSSSRSPPFVCFLYFKIWIRPFLKGLNLLRNEPDYFEKKLKAKGTQNINKL